MRNLVTVAVSAAALMFSAAASAETISGAIAYKDATDNIQVKTGKFSFDDQDMSKIRLALADRADIIASKAKILKLETENRSIVVAAFHDIGDLATGTTMIVKATLLEGKNGKLLYGDIFTRKCDKSAASVDADEEQALDRVVMMVKDRKGCDTDYRGGILLTNLEKGDQAPVQGQDQDKQDQGQNQSQSQDNQGQSQSK